MVNLDDYGGSGINMKVFGSYRTSLELLTSKRNILYEMKSLRFEITKVESWKTVQLIVERKRKKRKHMRKGEQKKKRGNYVHTGV